MKGLDETINAAQVRGYRLFFTRGELHKLQNLSHRSSRSCNKFLRRIELNCFWLVHVGVWLWRFIAGKIRNWERRRIWQDASVGKPSLESKKTTSTELSKWENILVGDNIFVGSLLREYRLIIRDERKFFHLKLEARYAILHRPGYFTCEKKKGRRCIGRLGRRDDLKLLRGKRLVYSELMLMTETTFSLRTSWILTKAQDEVYLGNSKSFIPKLAVHPDL